MSYSGDTLDRAWEVHAAVLLGRASSVRRDCFSWSLGVAFFEITGVLLKKQPCWLG